MKVSIKSLEVDMDIKNKGVELEVFEANGTDRLGDLVITKTELIWCDGRTRRENGIKLKWPDFIEMIRSNGRSKKKVTAKQGRKMAKGKLNPESAAQIG